MPSETAMNATRWTCEKCGGASTVTYPADADVYRVVELIRASHAAYAPSCATDLTRIRVAVADLHREEAHVHP